MYSDSKMKKANHIATAELLSSMLIFGTIGIFRSYIPFPSGFIAMARGLIGALFIALIFLVKRKKPNLAAIKKNAGFLILSGALIGFNWMLLFEAYNYTSVAVATLCYYMTPIFVIIASPVFLGEKLSLKGIGVSLTALFGMILVSGVPKNGIKNASEIKGVLLALGAALLYSAVIILNKRFSGVPAYDRSAVQLTSAFAVLIPYVIFAENVSRADFTPCSIILLVTVGILHTGIAYALYFDSVGKLRAQKIAIFGYADPILAIILSAVILKERMDVFNIIGAVLIIGAAILYEIPFKKSSKDKAC